MTDVRARGFVAAAIFAVLFAGAGASSAGAPRVIPPGKEGFFAEVLGGDAPVAGCTRSDASIDRDHVVARFRCGADEAVIEIRPPAPDRPASARTEKFTLVVPPGGAAPPLLVEGIRERILAREASFAWVEPNEAVEVHPPGTTFGPSFETPVERALGAFGIRWRRGLETAMAIILATLALGAGLVFAGRRRAPAPRAEGARLPGLLARLLVAAFLVVAVLVVSRFRFVEDDFCQLLHALDRPWEMDDSLRLVSSTLFYGIGLRLGKAWYMAVNLVVWVGSAGLLHALLRRALTTGDTPAPPGHTRDAAIIAAALYGLSPGYFHLVRSATGFQTSASIGLSYVVLLLVDAAGRARAEERARRAGLIMLALGLTAAGVLVKYPMMAVVPFLAWVWGKRIVRAASPPLSRHAFYASFAVAAGVPLLLAHAASAQAGELDKAGVSRLAANVGLLVVDLVPDVGRLISGAVILYLGLALQGRRSEGWAARRDLVRAAILEDLRGPPATSPWKGPFALLAVISAAPFLFNGRYFAPYYVVPCWAWISALAAIPLASAARRLQGRGRVATVLAAAALVPITHTTLTFDPRVGNDPTPVLDAARRATSGLPAPCSLVLRPSCPTSEATATSAADLRKLYDVTAGRDGIRWATGWHTIDVAVEGDPRWGEIPTSCAAPLTLRYCAGEGMAPVESPR